MKFKDFKLLVEFNTQDSQSKVPVKFSDWQLLITQSIKSIADKLELESLVSSDILLDKVYREIFKEDDKDAFLKIPEPMESENSEINIIENLAMAVVYDISQMFTSDPTLKQKYIHDKETVMADHIWNKYTLKEKTR